MTFNDAQKAYVDEMIEHRLLRLRRTLEKNFSVRVEAWRTELAAKEAQHAVELGRLRAELEAAKQPRRWFGGMK